MKNKLFWITSLVLLLIFTPYSISFAESTHNNNHAKDYYDHKRLTTESNKYKKALEYINIIERDPGYLQRSNVLSVPIYAQQGEYYCAPACAQMVIKHVRNKSIAQSTLASEMGTVTGEGTFCYRLAATLEDYCRKGYGYGHTSNRNVRSCTIYDIDKGLPLIYLVMTKDLNDNYAFNAGHYVVGSGYYTSKIRYIDPWNDSSFLGTHDVYDSVLINAMNSHSGYFIW